MRRLFAKVAVGAIGVFAAPIAQAQSLGASFTAVQHAYGQARTVQVSGARALELDEVDYAGVRWKSVDFIFDETGHLSRMAMTTTSAPYAAVMQLAQLQLKTPQPSGLAMSAEDAAPEMQLRVCERDDGQVTLTYEPISTLS